MQASHLVIGTIALVTFALSASAQEPGPERQRDRVVRIARFDGDADRAALGIGTASAGKRDTLGLLVVSITSGGPAEQAGLQEGDRIRSINGTSLTLSPGDAGEHDMDGLMTRRLVRELQRVKPGDEVKLEVWRDGRTRTVSVKTTALDELETRSMRLMRDDDSSRAAIGLDFGGRGSVRDTLGLLVVSLAPGGPAEKAGLEEGNRIQAINGVDVRVPRDEAGSDDWFASPMQNRFVREMRKVKPGDAVELKVYADGAVKTVRVTTKPADEVYPRSRFPRIRIGGMGEGIAPLPPMPPMSPMTPMTPLPDIQWRWSPEVSRRVETSMRSAEQAMRAAERAMRGHGYGLGRAGEVMLGRAPRGLMTAVGTNDDFDFAAPGLRVTAMSPELADYFGVKPDQGLLVLQADDPWTALHAGDVIVKVNGRRVRSGSTSSLSLETSRDNAFEVIRKGKTLTITEKAKD